MIEELIELDKKIFLYLNGLHTPTLDPVMFYISQTVIWVPLYLVLLFLVLKHFRNDSWAPLLGILITILIADQTMTAILKPVFQRLRPTHEPTLAGLVHTVRGYKGGLYGFASSHASNTFGLATLLWFYFRNKWRWISFLFPWAIIVSYSRIYLGVHYPGDIITGFFVGFLAAMAGLSLFKWLEKKFLRNKNNLGGSVE
jgi:undecaprenyl-diphosphatase